MTKWIKLSDDGSMIDVVYLERPDDVQDLVEAADEVIADWRLVDGAFVPPPPLPPPVPFAITARQFALEARDRGFITQAEALAFAASRVIPAAMREAINALPTQSMRDDAEITIAGATQFLRHDGTTVFIGEAMRGEAPLDDFLDDFFRAAGAR